VRKDTIFKETADLRKTMRGQLPDVSVVLVLWIISTNRNNLVIFLSLHQNDKVI
jgi:hypothetical protein